MSYELTEGESKSIQKGLMEYLESKNLLVHKVVRTGTVEDTVTLTCAEDCPVCKLQKKLGIKGGNY